MDIEARSITARYGDTAVLQAVDFTARAGEMVGLIGPNGSGKTTLLRILANLRTPEAGTIRYSGKTAAELGALASAALSSAGVAHQLQYAGNMFSIFFSDAESAGVPVTDYDGARRQDVYRFAAFFHAMLDAGVYLPPSPFESWFLSTAHDDDALGRVADALPAAARAAASATPAER